MQRQARPPEKARKERGERVDHRAELGKDQHLSWREAITSAISRRRSHLPLSSSFHA
jgi:hypothetical protein